MHALWRLVTISVQPVVPGRHKENLKICDGQRKRLHDVQVACTVSWATARLWIGPGGMAWHPWDRTAEFRPWAAQPGNNPVPTRRRLPTAHPPIMSTADTGLSSRVRICGRLASSLTRSRPQYGNILRKDTQLTHHPSRYCLVGRIQQD